ncbi:DUF6318 family protein [Nocardioides sp. R1-1]|uniref:DUF6318 family protein n=1 Tax=Nocardioides sp. R1-1 TaxID=3383502 RepID=UPI0038D13319
MALVLLIVGVTACSDDEPAPHDPSSTWSPTGTMEAPSSTAAAVPVEPRLPDAAREASEAGARAFIAYYWELVNYAQVTGDVKALRAASSLNCAGCNAGIRGVRERRRSGQRVVGGPHEAAIKMLEKLQTDSGDLNGYHAVVVARHDEQTAIGADGSEDVRAAGESTFDMYLIWVDQSGWRTDILDVK